MIYGLYLSATGVVTSAHRQDVIANNLANSETVGFKRDVAVFQERLTEAQQRRLSGQSAPWSDPLLEHLTGGTLASPTHIDQSQGEFEHTGEPLDVAIEGDGFFAVAGKDGAGGPPRLTRDGRFMIDRDGNLVLANSAGHRVLDPAGKPIQLRSTSPATIGADGTITQDGKPVGRVGVFDVAARGKLTKVGGNLLAYPDPAGVRPVDRTVHSEVIERANVDPTTELTDLMDAQRQLEANANMIRYQDQTLQKLVNEVGKIS